MKTNLPHDAAILSLILLSGCTTTRDTVGNQYGQLTLPLPGRLNYIITSTPAGADIYLNGQLKGKTNLQWGENQIQTLGTTVIEAKLPGA